jgi:hypothetical protein
MATPPGDSSNYLMSKLQIPRPLNKPACKFLLHKAFNVDRLAYKDCVLQETDQMLRGDRCYKSLLRLGRSVNAP